MMGPRISGTDTHDSSGIVIAGSFMFVLLMAVSLLQASYWLKIILLILIIVITQQFGVLIKHNEKRKGVRFLLHLLLGGLMLFFFAVQLQTPPANVADLLLIGTQCMLFYVLAKDFWDSFMGLFDLPAS